ncbi:hypothetical protein PHYPSEUDO_004666 [Phytophthora pseudosyringae]|uniref:Uncharacterized protein n=1 Tax=Phytophthora pseudosyringae TaxID=221518 RepID=A0A8T1VMS4_9STRA|nr:hypothetical protein PHYPSEUDO_004666 [Phytophthora pseudosyringae]
MCAGDDQEAASGSNGEARYRDPPAEFQRASSELPDILEDIVEPRPTASSLPAALQPTHDATRVLSWLREHRVPHPGSEGKVAPCLKKLFMQRKSDRRAVIRHHKELLQSMALLKVTLESLFARWG